jgi:hypothetical protein
VIYRQNQFDSITKHVTRQGHTTTTTLSSPCFSYYGSVAQYIALVYQQLALSRRVIWCVFQLGLVLKGLNTFIVFSY